MLSSSEPANREIITQKIQCYDRKLVSPIFKNCHWAQIFDDRTGQDRTGQAVSIHIIRLGMNVGI